MKNVYVLWHLGLGDHILCNGLIRSISSKYNNILLPVKHHNILNIQDLFKDLENVKLVPILDDRDMIKYCDYLDKNSNDILRIGIFGDSFMKNCNTFDESFYNQVSIDYFYRWSKFYYAVEQEKQIKLNNLTENEYVFVHDDISRNLNIKEKYINDKLIYRPSHNLGAFTNNTIFQYYDILHKSREIHCMDSSFACLIDHISSLKDKPKFIHRYIRKHNNNPNYLNNWTILND